MCHLFYAGPVRSAGFKNFELEVEARARAGCQLRRLLPHRLPGDADFPQKGCRGPDQQHPVRARGRRPARSTTCGTSTSNSSATTSGSSSTSPCAARMSRCGSTGCCWWTTSEPAPPVHPAEHGEGAPALDRGTFALQCHDPGIQGLRSGASGCGRLPDDLATPGGATRPWRTTSSSRSSTWACAATPWWISTST